MASKTINPTNAPFEMGVFAPMRHFFLTMTGHAEKIAGIQFETARICTDMAFRNAYAALEIRDAEAMQNYLGKQPEVAQELGERIKADAEKLAAANQALVEDAQRVTRDNVTEMQKAAEKSVEQVQEAAGAVTATAEKPKTTTAAKTSSRKATSSSAKTTQ